MTNKKKRKYWYMAWYYKCPVCGRGTIEKENDIMWNLMTTEQKEEFEQEMGVK